MRFNVINKYAFFIIFSVVCQSLAYGVLSGHQGDVILLFVVQGFLITSIFYFLLSGFEKSKVKRKHIIPLFTLNISTAIAFLCFYLSIYFIPASISSLIEASAGPLWGVVIGYLFVKQKVSLYTIINSMLIFICSLVVLCIESNSNFSGKDIIGLSLSLLAAFGATLIAFSSSKVELPAITILAYRFHLTWVLSLVIFLCIRDKQFSYFNLSYLILSFIGVTLPMYFLQVGMEKVHPIITMICLSFVPIITYVFEFYFGKEFNFAIFAILLFSVGLAVFQLRRAVV